MITRMLQPGGIAVLCADPGVHALVTRSCAIRGQSSVVFETLAQLISACESWRPCAIVVDREHLEHAALAAIGASIILVVRDLGDRPPVGAELVVFESSLADALGLASRPLEAPRPVLLARLVAVSLLAGPRATGLEAACVEIAAGFGVDRCVISIREDLGGATLDPSTWDSVEHCRMSVSASATVLAMTSSYLAVPLATPLGRHGFIGLVTTTSTRFSAEERAALQALAARLAGELGWQAAHGRTADELARLVSGPGLDPLVGIWNHAAMTQLMITREAAAARSHQPLTVLVIDVVDLRGINTKFGLKVGDLVLARVADAVRANVRVEDLVGRWSGDKTIVVLHDITFEAAQPLAEGLHAGLATRAIELTNGERVAIPVTIGIATLQPHEELTRMVARAVAAGRGAPAQGRAIAAAAPSLVAPMALQLEIVEEPPVTLAGTYRFRHEISRGAMGVVYRADDLALERPVAIKMLRPDLAEDRELIERLRAEAALLARIQHPNLVQIYSFGQVGGDSYFVMELVEGEGIQQAIARHKQEGTMPPLAVNVAVIAEVASALDALHERGIIHRDVKPANIIRDPFRNRGVLVDVGIAHRFGELANAAGTPGFIAPEVVEGGEATARSDVYGLAATTYAMLTLVEPFGDGSSLEVLARQSLAEPPPRPSSHVARLAPVDAIILAGLDRDPARRPATAGEFARALTEALSIPAPLPRRAASAPQADIVAAQTRGIVFRAVARVLGVHQAARFRDAIGDRDPELAVALIDTAPLAWLPTTMLSRLLAVAPDHLELDAAQLARDIARACIRASFRRMFPSSASTLMPERTLSAIRNVWGRYHSWGLVSSMPGLSPTSSRVQMTQTLRSSDLCAWTAGMLEQIVVLSGGGNPVVEHGECQALGHDACRFGIRWEPAR